jgi:hypothetical protein
MSNPGVIFLNTSKVYVDRIICGDRLWIEDNIGEAIHIHYRNMRFDFSIDEFLQLANAFYGSLKEVVENENINLDLISWEFLFEIKEHLYHVISTKIVDRELDELRVAVYSDGPQRLYKVVKLIDSPAYKYCVEADEGFIEYKQVGTPTINNKDRFDALLKSIEKNGYPYKNRYITVLGNENIIRDGYHRAAILRSKSGNIKVPVLQINFKEDYGKYKLRNGSSLFDKTIWLLRKIKRKLWRQFIKKR